MTIRFLLVFPLGSGKEYSSRGSLFVELTAPLFPCRSVDPNSMSFPAQASTCQIYYKQPYAELDHRLSSIRRGSPVRAFSFDDVGGRMAIAAVTERQISSLSETDLHSMIARVDLSSTQLGGNSLSLY